jgi:hypothetical protein
MSNDQETNIYIIGYAAATTWWKELCLEAVQASLRG